MRICKLMKINYLLGLTVIFAGLAMAAPPQEGRHVAGRLLAQPIAGADPNRVAAVLASLGTRLHHTIGGINTHVIEVAEPAANRVADMLMRSGLFTFVERDYLAEPASGAVTPNDPDFSSQWHLATINAAMAWGVTTGVSNVTIAVIDSGVDSTHPDMGPKLVAGWNFVNGSSNTADDYGHGTAVAGTAAADTNNGMGVSGVGWNNMIMPLVALDSTGYASYSNMASAIQYAADHGARIINISLGGSSSSSTLQSAVNYAWGKGSVVFASAMNNSSTTPYYPAACTYVVAVSATEPTGTLASFSNYGNWISLSAPGDNILTTVSGGGYGYWWGTSFASPIAAAVGALVLSIQPGMSASSLVSLLEQNSDDLGTPGFDQYFGYGQVDAYKAVLAAGSPVKDTTPPTVSIASPANGATVSGTTTIQVNASDNVGVTSIQLSIDGTLVSSTSASSLSFGWNTSNYSNSTHTISATASDAAGNVSTATATVTVSNVIKTSSTPPTITITNPSNGAQINGNVNIGASVSSSGPVSQVSFYIDGVLKCTDTSSPYSCEWNTKKVSAGQHTVSATAWNSAGSGSTSITVTYK